MTYLEFVRQPRRWHWTAAIVAAFALAIWAASVDARDDKLQLLRIGTSGDLTPEGGGHNEKSSLDTLKSFIKDETGLDNEIVRQKNWQELATKMSKGELDVGVFQGFEFARALPQYPELKPLAVAVNVYVYPVVYLVAGANDQAKDFAGLQGQSLTLVNPGPGYIQLYVDAQCEAAGKKPEAFFSKIVNRDNFEDALDDVVDGVSNATAADRAALESYKRRKPGRFGKLKPVCESQPFPPAVVAYYGNHLDESTRKRFHDGLLSASQKDRGQTMLTLFRLTGFQDPPGDFDKVLAATRAAYPSKGNGSGK
jgi:ABC-type phosphate/phosphonate transport system substrate-binding protein